MLYTHKHDMCLQDLSLQHITNIMWTYASFLHEVLAMMAAFRQQILQRTQIEQFNAQQLSNLLWSLCIFQAGPLTIINNNDNINIASR